MVTKPKRLLRAELRRFDACPVKCARISDRVSSLADYLALLSAILSDEDRFWFRGHEAVKWSLTPSALRYKRLKERNSAIQLLGAFKRVAEIKLQRLPYAKEDLKWLQLAQHYGIPTRLLDWTESATFALYFACAPSSSEETDGMVFFFNPQHLEIPRGRRAKASMDSERKERYIAKYFDLDGRPDPRNGLPTIAINPVWNSQRLMMQRGVFTLHGSRRFALDAKQAPSLVGIPILREAKEKLRQELARIGVDEMTVFPELEHACRHLKRVELGDDT